MGATCSKPDAQVAENGAGKSTTSVQVSSINGVSTPQMQAGVGGVSPLVGAGNDFSERRDYSQSVPLMQPEPPTQPAPPSGPPPPEDLYEKSRSTSSASQHHLASIMKKNDHRRCFSDSDIAPPTAAAPRPARQQPKTEPRSKPRRFTFDQPQFLDEKTPPGSGRHKKSASHRPPVRRGPQPVRPLQRSHQPTNPGRIRQPQPIHKPRALPNHSNSTSPRSPSSPSTNSSSSSHSNHSRSQSHGDLDFTAQRLQHSRSVHLPPKQPPANPPNFSASKSSGSGYVRSLSEGELTPPPQKAPDPRTRRTSRGTTGRPPRGARIIRGGNRGRNPRVVRRGRGRGAPRRGPGAPRGRVAPRVARPPQRYAIQGEVG